MYDILWINQAISYPCLLRVTPSQNIAVPKNSSYNVRAHDTQHIIAIFVSFKVCVDDRMYSEVMKS